ncbi:MAG: glycosyltransferase family 39 protein [Verrucomicrobia bacterium]|nr:glycosyltransferase family 39 protein [Verrucomicrobiota bacterium]
MSNPNPPVAAAPASRWLRWLELGALAAYAAFIAVHASTVAGGSDSSGYLNSARLLASGRLLADLRGPAEFGPPGQVDRLHFFPQGFFPHSTGLQLAPTYPTGLPLHLALAGKLLGWQAGPLLVEILAAVGAVWLCYRVARELGLGVPLAAAGAAALAGFPVFIFTSIQPLSDTLATTWGLAALYAALRARRGRGWSAVSGAALAFAVLVRPTNLLLVPALLVLLGRDWRRLALFALGGIPGAVWLAAYNHHLYGNTLRSGYGDDIGAAFAVAYALPAALHFAKWLALLLPAALLPLPFVALARRDLRSRELLALAVAFLAVAGFYVFYEFSHEVWWSLRFILPVVPALILAGLLGVEALARGPGARWPGHFRPAAALVLVLWAAGNSWYWTKRLAVLMMKSYEQTYADASVAARERLPTNALVVANAFSGAIYFHTGFSVLRWDQIDARGFARYAALTRQSGRPVCALLFDAEENEALQIRCPGRWTRLARVHNAGLWQLDDDSGAPAR